MEHLPTHDSYHNWYAKALFQDFRNSRAFDRARGFAVRTARRLAGDYPEPFGPQLMLVVNAGNIGAPANVYDSSGSYRSSGKLVSNAKLGVSRGKCRREVRG